MVVNSIDSIIIIFTHTFNFMVGMCGAFQRKTPISVHSVFDGLDFISNRYIFKSSIILSLQMALGTPIRWLKTGPKWRALACMTHSTWAHSFSRSIWFLSHTYTHARSCSFLWNEVRFHCSVPLRLTEIVSKEMQIKRKTEKKRIESKDTRECFMHHKRSENTLWKKANYRNNKNKEEKTVSEEKHRTETNRTSRKAKQHNWKLFTCLLLMSFSLLRSSFNTD